MRDFPETPFCDLCWEEEAEARDSEDAAAFTEGEECDWRIDSVDRC